jgi:hypothetical protein
MTDPRKPSTDTAPEKPRGTPERPDDGDATIVNDRGLQRSRAESSANPGVEIGDPVPEPDRTIKADRTSKDETTNATGKDRSARDNPPVDETG